MAAGTSLRAREQALLERDESGGYGASKLGALRKTAALVGALFLISNVTFLLGSVVFVEPVLGSADYLNVIADSRGQVILGVVLELTNAVAYLGIAALIFPILKQRFESLALAYVALRILEFVMQTLAELSPLSLLTLGQDFAQAGSTPALEITGAVLLAGRSWSFQMVSITFGLGAILFYVMMVRTRLIHRFVAVWGLIGAAGVLVSTIVAMFDPGLEFLGNVGVLMLLNELFLGVWLLAKGFSPQAQIGPANTTTPGR